MSYPPAGPMIASALRVIARPSPAALAARPFHSTCASLDKPAAPPSNDPADDPSKGGTGFLGVSKACPITALSVWTQC
jgi:hypothetical protein